MGLRDDCAMIANWQGSLLDILGEEELASQVTWGACLLAIATDVAKGMAYLHYNDFLHRDLKPGNVLLSEHWVAKVADFGATFQVCAGRGVHWARMRRLDHPHDPLPPPGKTPV